MRKPNEIKSPPEDEAAKKWVVKIREDCGQTVASIVKIGHDLIKAQDELGHGVSANFSTTRRPLQKMLSRSPGAPATGTWR